MPDGTTGIRGGGRALDWAARVALLTVELYASVILFEVGYFWRIGGSAMAAFAPTEHAVHAVGRLGIIGLVVFACLAAALFPNLVLSIYQSDTVGRSDAAGSGPFERPLWRRVASVLPFLGMLGFSAFGVLPDLYRTDGISPIFAAAVAAFVAMATWAVEALVRGSRDTYRLPAAVLAVLVLPAAGEQAFVNASSTANGVPIEMPSDRGSRSAVLIFAGTDKLIVADHGALFFEDYAGGWRRGIGVAATGRRPEPSPRDRR